MKNRYFKYALLIITLFLSSILNGQEPYFCVKKGAKLEYTERSVNDDVQGYVQMEILDVRDDVQNMDTLTVVSYNSAILDKEREPKSDVPMRLVANISGDNTLSINLAESIALMFKEVTEEKEVDEDMFKMSGEPMLLPSNMKVGDLLPDSHLSIEVLFLDINMYVTERVVLREEVLTTDFGVYPCMVVKERITCSGMVGFNKKETIVTWYSRGVGMVKQEKYNKRGKLEIISLLTASSF